jgi:chromate reductase, NAD(P)H dehydrogenase (quinone)
MAERDSSTLGRREPVRVLVFAASLRAGSVNERLAQLAGSAIEANDGTVEFAAMADFDAPSNNADAQADSGFPDLLTR